ncbi:uncharacterized protein LOC111012615 [Momordica charantia]|uniref:Uncharacterized protein LOC111012615 n=1 Tax=Momordica charantia TaxID=3673 RepID=A0A6J1CL55_MOMCH|nr:uncharacterized protein LOC111012615 [Momordica charantia]
MMTRFCRFHDSVKPFWFSFFFFFFLLLGHGFPVVVESAEGDTPVSDLLSRDDWRQMAGYGEERLSTVLVTGSVLCEACLHGDEPQLHSWPISGAMVGVSCHNNGRNSKSSDWAHGVTDEFGDFIIDIPSHLHATRSFEKVCSIKILQTPKNARCRPAHFAGREQLQLSSFGGGIRTYTSGALKLQHRTSRPLQGCINKGSGDKQTLW